MGTLPDGSVTGKIMGGDTTASFSAGVSCFGGQPSGSIQGNIRTFTGRDTSNFSFSSSNAEIVGTLLSDSLQFVEGKFVNVTLKKNSALVSSNCVAILTAERLTGNSWVGSLAIICPGGKELVVFGVFTGPVSVLKQVICKPLL
ncbi:hypothetical protein [Phosphitispora fastidiosa]|uniref:hypothetical protein n=1 Tax=Phosphitispora fastidiosa TaxID=2837202 RepID=UPI001E2F8D19|nr:hypothetical protein [Phosphitispora fastidiosa]MBU7008658.1 hypothetical protein [Phosphitispora fastidiosa]